MDDGNVAAAKDEKHGPLLTNLYADLVTPRITANGHDLSSDVIPAREVPLKPHYEQHEGQFRRINPLKIHLGKRPFVDNSIHYQTGVKRKNSSTSRLAPAFQQTPVPPRPIPKLIPRKGNGNQFLNKLSSHQNKNVSDGKPVPRLIPKSQLSQFKKGKVEKSPQLNEYTQYLGLQPMVQYKCSKCCAMFNTLPLLNDHQQECRVQSKETVPSPEGVPAEPGGPSRVTRKVFLCSACGTYYENWNLFLHMREIHNRHICLFCLGMFSKAQKLAAHLISKHNVSEQSYNNKEEFCNMYNDSFYLMCCTCAEIYSEQDDFFTHDCNNVKPKPVPVLVSKNTSRSNVKTLSKNQNLSINIMGNGSTPPPVKAPPDVLTIEPVPEIDKETVQEKKNVVPPLIIKTNPQSKVAESHTDTSKVDPLFKDNDCDITPRIPEHTEQDNDNDSTDTAESPVSQSSFKHDIDLVPRTGNNENAPEIDKLSPPIDSDMSTEIIPLPQEEKYPSIEKDCGIKLKLSLKNATKSPVIINSTVDPSIGRHVSNKPPLRVRRPPKRYEKEKSQPSTPTIKMTICDKADSSFVKTTIIDSKEYPSTNLVINNNLDSTKQSPKLDNTIKSTIYDNIDDSHSLNRVPKLTVRVPKELLDKDSSSEYSSDSDASDKLMVDEKYEDETPDTSVHTLLPPPVNVAETNTEVPTTTTDFESNDVPYLQNEEHKYESTNSEVVEDDNREHKDITETDLPVEPTPVYKSSINDEIPITELTLDKPLDKYPLKDLLKVFLKATVFNCIYCNHVRKIAINCEQLSLHMVAEHQFRATVNSITAEELLPETITTRVRAGAADLRAVIINLDTYDNVEDCEKVIHEHLFECFQCYYKTTIHKDLYLHNRKMHQNILLCVMCKTNFYNYSELLCHLCPGTYNSEVEIRFRCYMCNFDAIPSSFRLMVHLRKVHHTCDVCLEYCFNQLRLSNHVWKHKLHHLCYRCGIAYRNKADITKHLFWKHGTESVLCKKCLQKKWPHVYHFCAPPTTFICDECSLSFSKAVCLRVHKRFHSKEFPHVCTEEGCTEKFVSKKLLIKHAESHKPELPEPKELNITIDESLKQESKDVIPVIDLVGDKPKEEKIPTDKNVEKKETEPLSKKTKKKKNKDSDLLLDVNLPELNLSESDSESDEEHTTPPQVKTDPDEQTKELKAEAVEPIEEIKPILKDDGTVSNVIAKVEEKTEPTKSEKPDEQALDIWDNFKKYQAKVERKKTPPLVPIKKHVCESDHDYCIIPSDLNGDDDVKHTSKKLKKSPRAKGDSSSSSSSSDSDSSCLCNSNCSCSSSSGSSSSSSSGSDTSHLSDRKVKKRPYKKRVSNRRTSSGSQQSAVDVMGVADTPLLIAEKQEPLVAESDLETEESATDEEFYDEYPQRLANKLLAEKRNQLMLLASVAPLDNGSMSGEVSRCTTPIRDEPKPKKEKSSSKKKSKKKKKSKSSKKTSLKLNIPKEVLNMPQYEKEVPIPPLIPNKITISLQTNKVHLPATPPAFLSTPNSSTPLQMSQHNKRASKRRRVPNRFYGYSSDEDNSQPPGPLPVFKPQLPPKLEWRKEDLPSPNTPRPKKEMPSVTIPQRLPASYFSFPEPLRLTAPIPDPEPPRLLMNSESSETESEPEPVPPPPPHLQAGTSSLPYPFVRPPVRQAREGESVYCYCRCPYDEVSEMIACDADGCSIEWFHFECVGIMVPPKGKWYCPECRRKLNYSNH